MGHNYSNGCRHSERELSAKNPEETLSSGGHFSACDFSGFLLCEVQWSMVSIFLNVPYASLVWAGSL